MVLEAKVSSANQPKIAALSYFIFPDFQASTLIFLRMINEIINQLSFSFAVSVVLHWLQIGLVRDWPEFVLSAVCPSAWLQSGWSWEFRSSGSGPNCSCEPHWNTDRKDVTLIMDMTMCSAQKSQVSVLNLWHYCFVTWALYYNSTWTPC